jgi:hypothetical protein
LRGEFYRKYLAQYLKLDVGGFAKTPKYIRFMTNMMKLNLLSLVHLGGLDM